MIGRQNPEEIWIVNQCQDAEALSQDPDEVGRLRIEAGGAVQGVGFRPFVHRLAVSEGLTGFVRNTAEGVALEIEGVAPALARFLARLEAELAPPAAMRARRVRRIAPTGQRDFSILPSRQERTPDQPRLPVVLPDLATCAACLAEIREPGNRRYRYPFTTCVQCGPRFSLIEDVPYDRARTTMRRFAMCAACQAEYDDPRSRRFHAETNACPRCGPQLRLWDAAGREIAAGDQALLGAAGALRDGVIVALKGLGGFQLLVDARNDLAVRRLRERKGRPTKPFALMVPDCEAAQALAEVDAAERQLLCSPAAPIVLLRAREGAIRFSPATGAHGMGGVPPSVAPSVAPLNPWLGIMLPYTPLHHLLMRELGAPVVATSGNRGGDPIVADETQALEQLAGLADLFLVHDRPIAHPVDDSVTRVIGGEPVVLRNARGYAPLVLSPNDEPDASPTPTPTPTLALGGHGKSAVALAYAEQLVLGPYVGDLEGVRARTAFAGGIEAMRRLYRVRPQTVACDTHPDYHSTQVAEREASAVQYVPHHLAHVLAGMADNGLSAPLLGVAWDGSGYGGDGTVWGGEFILVKRDAYRRVAHLQPFRLPGGEAAVREPDRAALGALHAVFGDAMFDDASLAALPPIAALAPRERRVFAAMLTHGTHAPWTSSAGRLFDAVAALLGLCARSSFDGEAAIALEAAATCAAGLYPLAAPELGEARGQIVADWRPTLAALVRARLKGVDAADLAAGFHQALAQLVVEVAARVGEPRVLLSGGCFQNALLSERATAGLRAAGLAVWRHHRVPPNDGGLAAGQAAFARHPLMEEKT